MQMDAQCCGRSVRLVRAEWTSWTNALRCESDRHIDHSCDAPQHKDWSNFYLNIPCPYFIGVIRQRPFQAWCESVCDPSCPSTNFNEFPTQFDYLTHNMLTFNEQLWLCASRSEAYAIYSEKWHLSNYLRQRNEIWLLLHWLTIKMQW